MLDEVAEGAPSGAMTLAERISRAPRPFDMARAAEARSALGANGPAADLIAGVAGCSLYLKGLIEIDPEWLEAALAAPPEETLQKILAQANAAEGRELGTALRLAKRRVALLVALCDCGGVWSLEEVTGALTRLADRAVSLAWEREIAAEIRRGRLPETAAPAGGLVVMAMGKMGAFELNYSSDIDLICLFDDTAYGDGAMEARSALVKATRRAAALLSETTAEGYVFRTDLRLRPDPSVTPVCLSMESAERYYESLGRTWERAAHIKARPCAGDIEAGTAYLERLRPFVWRRHLDFAAIEDAHAIRQRIRDHRGLGGPITLAGHDMKLGRGGIREIEFFTQTRQIIAGGRDPGLRVRGTVEGLGRLAAAGWIDEEVARQLSDDYRAHREVEHRLQMIADLQTHSLPDDAEGIARVAAFLDRDLTDLEAELTDRLERVSDLTEDFFAPSAPPPGEGPDLSQTQAEIVQKWRGLPALRSERALDIFDRIRPRLLRKLLASPKPDRALAHFDGFLKGLPAGVQLFSLFEANPELLDLIADIAGTTPELAAHLSRNAAVLDAVLGGQFFADWPGYDVLMGELTRALEAESDYERRLDRARSWTRDWHFRVGVHHLRGLIDGAAAGRQYADLAEVVVTALWPVVVGEFAGKHGAPPGRGAMVLGMGSLGAGHLTARSDLDLIVIYDADGADGSDGPRPLSARAYYARLTQALITALTAPTAAGRLYDVDMRLRPSGKQGPVATALSAFDRYQREEAWTWEHQALTRARPLTGAPALCDAVADIRAAVVSRPRDVTDARADTVRMRDRLAQARPGGDWDVKSGRGRLTDIELFAATLALLSGSTDRAPAAQIAAGAGAGLLDAGAAETLAACHARLSRFQDAKRLLVEEAFVPGELGQSAEAMVLRETGCDGIAELSDRIDDWTRDSARLIDEALG